MGVRPRKESRITQVNEHVTKAIKALEQGLVIEALDYIADHVKHDREKYVQQGENPNAAVIGLLNSVEASLRAAASEYEMSFK
jgi:23S rRNA maturation mini-RNase III